MEVAVRSGNLQELAQRLQESLRTDKSTCALSLTMGMPWQVQCVLKQGTLMVLSQHPPDQQVPERQQIFATLEAVIQAIAPEFVSPVLDLDIPYCTQVKLYLRELGQNQPYAAHSFRLVPEDMADLEQATSEMSGNPTLSSISLKSFYEEAPGFEADNQETLNASSASERSAESSLALLAIQPDADSSELTSPLEPAAEESLGEQKSAPWRRISWIAAAIAVSMMSFAGGIFLTNRPCMLRQCDSFEQAQNLIHQSTETLQAGDGKQNLWQVQQQLTQANQLLSTIPPWSGQHQQAQTLLQQQQVEAAALERVLAAETKANIAIQKGQAAPQLVNAWQNVQALWQEAIAQLETIPSSSPVAAIAHKRLQSYRASLTTVNQAMAAERQGQSNLKQAKTAAQKAEARQGIAQTLENWKLVQDSWQVAVNNLLQVPSNTTSQAEAQKLLAIYQTKLTLVQDHIAREQAASKAYAQALQLAGKAQQLQQRNQWTQAVITWRNALTSARRVPQETPYYDQAQVLIPPYQESLKQAQTQLQAVVARQRTLADLARICAGTPKTCLYTVTNSLIRLQFTPAYEQAVRNALAAGQTGNYGAAGGALNHIESLRMALQAIANNSGIPLEAYSADGSEVIWGFNPGGG